jgi:radical SAM modification target selenobiotic family peptide
MIVDKEHVKKILAGLSIAGLLTGAGMTTPSFGASG